MNISFTKNNEGKILTFTLNGVERTLKKPLTESEFLSLSKIRSAVELSDGSFFFLINGDSTSSDSTIVNDKIINSGEQIKFNFNKSVLNSTEVGSPSVYNLDSNMKITDSREATDEITEFFLKKGFSKTIYIYGLRNGPDLGVQNGHRVLIDWTNSEFPIYTTTAQGFINDTSTITNYENAVSEGETENVAASNREIQNFDWILTEIEIGIPNSNIKIGENGRFIEIGRNSSDVSIIGAETILIDNGFFPFPSSSPILKIGEATNGPIRIGSVNRLNDNPIDDFLIYGDDQATFKDIILATKKPSVHFAEVNNAFSHGVSYDPNAGPLGDPQFFNLGDTLTQGRILMLQISPAIFNFIGGTSAWSNLDTFTFDLENMNYKVNDDFKIKILLNMTTSGNDAILTHELCFTNNRLAISEPNDFSTSYYNQERAGEISNYFRTILNVNDAQRLSDDFLINSEALAGGIQIALKATFRNFTIQGVRILIGG